MKIRDATLQELAPKERKAPELSPRQLAIRKRQQVIAKALDELAASPLSLVKRVELEGTEKLPTMRAAIAAQIKLARSSVKVSVRNGAIYLSRGPIPR
jgi:hypothetical protein